MGSPCTAITVGPQLASNVSRTNPMSPGRAGRTSIPLRPEHITPTPPSHVPRQVEELTKRHLRLLVQIHQNRQPSQDRRSQLDQSSERIGTYIANVRQTIQRIEGAADFPHMPWLPVSADAQRVRLWPHGWM